MLKEFTVTSNITPWSLLSYDKHAWMYYANPRILNIFDNQATKWVLDRNSRKMPLDIIFVSILEVQNL